MTVRKMLRGESLSSNDQSSINDSGISEKLMEQANLTGKPLNPESQEISKAIYKYFKTNPINPSDTHKPLKKIKKECLKMLVKMQVTKEMDQFDKFFLQLKEQAMRQQGKLKKRQLIRDKVKAQSLYG